MVSTHKAVFPQGMFQYHSRIRDRYDRSVVSLAVLSDSNQQFRPVSYADGRWGCRILFEFPMVKSMPTRSNSVMPYVTTDEQAGIQRGEAIILLTLLQEKFGPDTVDAYRERITAAESEELLQWSKRILSAETAETIFH